MRAKMSKTYLLLAALLSSSCSAGTSLEFSSSDLAAETAEAIAWWGTAGDGCSVGDGSRNTVHYVSSERMFEVARDKRATGHTVTRDYHSYRTVEVMILDSTADEELVPLLAHEMGHAIAFLLHGTHGHLPDGNMMSTGAGGDAYPDEPTELDIAYVLGE